MVELSGFSVVNAKSKKEAINKWKNGKEDYNSIHVNSVRDFSKFIDSLHEGENSYSSSKVIKNRSYEVIEELLSRIELDNIRINIVEDLKDEDGNSKSATVSYDEYNNAVISIDGKITNSDVVDIVIKIVSVLSGKYTECYLKSMYKYIDDNYNM